MAWAHPGGVRRKTRHASLLPPACRRSGCGGRRSNRRNLDRHPQGRADLRKRSSSDATVFVAGEEGAAADAAGCEWDLAFWKGQPKESVCDFVLERLEEKNRWNVEAVVDELGAVAALRLLQHVERVQRDGGMTCAPRNSAARNSPRAILCAFGRAML